MVFKQLLNCKGYLKRIIWSMTQMVMCKRLPKFALERPKCLIRAHSWRTAGVHIAPHSGSSRSSGARRRREQRPSGR